MWQPLLANMVNFAALPPSNCNPNTDNVNHTFFGFPHWWQYITTGQVDFYGHCSPVIDFPTGIWAIVLAITTMLLYLAGLAAVFSIIFSGISYMAAAGNPEK